MVIPSGSSPGRSELLRRLGIEYPIVLGPFGGGLSTARLTAAVSNRGGLGSFGAHNLEPEAIGSRIEQIRALTSRPFAINLWVSDHDPGGLDLDEETFERYFSLFEPYYTELGLPKPTRPQRYHPRFDDQIEVLIEQRPPAISFVFGVPSPRVLERCRERGIVTLGTASTPEEAEALDAAKLDVIVVSGFEAGGHRPSFLRPAEASLYGTFALTQLVARRVSAPVVAAGGIVDGAGIRAAMLLGAQGAQLGTAFLATVESGTHDAHRAQLFGQQAQQTVLTRSYTGRLARGILNPWIEALELRRAELAPFPVQSFFFAPIKAAALRTGRTDCMSLYAGQAAPNLRHRTADDLMTALVSHLDGLGIS